MASISTILLARSTENPSQSAFFRLKRLLNVVGCATITGFTLKQIGRCCVWGIGSRTDFSHIFEMFDDVNMRSGLFPFFHIALSNDFGSFAVCTSDRLFDSSHSSTAFPWFQRSRSIRGGTVRQQTTPANRDHLSPDSLMFVSASFLPRVSSQRLN